MPTQAVTDPLVLVPLGGPSMSPVEVDPARGATLGRAPECTVRLESPEVSRRHAAISCLNGRWFVTDLTSRHGTLVNGSRIEPDAATPLARGDHLSIGPWTLRAQMGRHEGSTVRSIDDTGGAPRIRPVMAGQMEALASSRLQLLMDSAERLHAAADEAALAREVTQAVVAGTAFTRALLVRVLDGCEKVELLASAGKAAEALHQGVSISRSLLTAAMKGHVVQLDTSPNLREAVSIVQGGVGEAVCAPVTVGTAVDAVLYADCGLGRATPDPAASAFVSALARLSGLALAGLKRAALERHQRELIRELSSARAVQKRIMPPSEGQVGPLRYACHSKPGRVVAGDLCGVAQLPGGSAAVFIGDVTGKGLGPALLMASAQAYLSSALRWSVDPAKVVEGANDLLSGHAAEGEFASLWFAIASPGGGLSCVDAGHGLAAVVRANGQPERVRAEGGVLLGVQSGGQYGSTTLSLAPGERLVLFTDGLLEQHGENGEQFGFERVLEALARCASPAEDVAALVAALATFAAGEAYADDVTIASFTLS